MNAQAPLPPVYLSMARIDEARWADGPSQFVLSRHSAATDQRFTDAVSSSVPALQAFAAKEYRLALRAIGRGDDEATLSWADRSRGVETNLRSGDYLLRRSPFWFEIRDITTVIAVWPKAPPQHVMVAGYLSGEPPFPSRRN